MQDHVTPPAYAYAVAGRAPYSSSETGFITHYDIKRFVKRYARTIIIATLLGVLVAGAYVFTAIPLYTARTLLIIDPSLPQAIQQSRQDGLFSLDNAQVESQLEVMRSEKIAKAVIKQLKLQDLPEFSGGGGSLFSLPFALFQSKSKPSKATTFAKQRVTLAKFQSQLNVRRVGMSYAIEILFSSRDPALAAKISNATANAYISEQIAARAHAARQGGLWLEERINQLRAQMNKAAHDAQEFRAKRDYRITSGQGGDSGGAAAANDKESGTKRQNTMVELDSTAQTYRRIYESYLMAYTESVQKQSYPITNARVITEATPPLSKSHPRTKLILAFGGMMGGLAGLGIAFFRNSIDRCVWGPRQIREVAGVECLASIPAMVDQTSSSARARAMFGRAAMSDMLKSVVDKPSSAIDTGGKTLKAAVELAGNALGGQKATASPFREGILDAVATMPFSGFSHGIKTLKTAIALAGRTRQIRCFAVTSALPNEGKTTICSNLALLFAMSGLRTLLVDGDLRNASLTRSLAPTAEFGLIDAICGTAELGNCIVQANDTGLHLLPAFGSTQTPYSDEILGSEKAQSILQDLQTVYEVIILDLPPLTASLEGLAIGSLLDCTVLVAEYGKTPAPVLSEAIHLLRTARADILGVALNKVDTSIVHYGDVAANYLSYGSQI
jgi:capsular exopolysaccharide synthesis family protein